MGELLLACQPLVYLRGQPGEEELPDPEGLVDQLAELQQRAVGGAGAEGAGGAGAARAEAAGATGQGVGAGVAGTSGAGGAGEAGGEGAGGYDSALGWIQGMYRGGELPNGQGGSPGGVALLDALLHRPPVAVPPSVLGAVPPSSSGAVQPSSSSGAAPLSSSRAGVKSLPTSELDALVSFNAFGDRFDDPVASAIADADARRRGGRRGDAGGGSSGGKEAGASVGEATAGAAGKVSDGGQGPGLRGGAVEAGEQLEEEEQEEEESVGTPHVGLWPHFSLMNHSVGCCLRGLTQLSLVTQRVPSFNSQQGAGLTMHQALKGLAMVKGSDKHSVGVKGELAQCLCLLSTTHYIMGGPCAILQPTVCPPAPPHQAQFLPNTHPLHYRTLCSFHATNVPPSLTQSAVPTQHPSTTLSDPLHLST